MQAEKERRTISAYVLNIVARAVDVDDRLFKKLSPYDMMNRVLSRKATIEFGSRTAILVRCSNAEADQIRSAARRRSIPVNTFVLQALKRAWSVHLRPPIVSVSADVDDGASQVG